MDVAAYAALLDGIQGLRVVAADTNLSDSAASCRKAPADVALFDATYPCFRVFDTAKTLLAQGALRTVAFLDDQFAIVRVQRALAIANSTYLTREHDLAPILEEIGERLDSQTDFRGRAVISIGATGIQFVQSEGDLRWLDHDGVLSLTARERQVVEYLAQGMTLKAIAEQLGVTHSTVDNHKTRLMKKLKLDKQTQIASVALRAGFIDHP